MRESVECFLYATDENRVYKVIDQNERFITAKRWDGNKFQVNSGNRAFGNKRDNIVWISKELAQKMPGKSKEQIIKLLLEMV